MATYKTGIDISGIKEYYFIKYFTWTDFPLLVSEVKRLGLQVSDTLEGISTRSVDVQSSECEFRILFRDDIGIYTYRRDQDLADQDQALRKIMDMIPDKK